MTAPVPDVHGELRGGLEPLLFPRSVAIVGASERNLRPLENARRCAERVVLVNPRRTEVAGLASVPSLAEAGDPPDATLFLVAHTRVAAAVEEALAAGARALVVPGIGAEAGPDAPAVSAAVRDLAELVGAAVVGPNCMGVARPDGPSTWIGTVPATFPPGNVSVVSQSGSIGEAFLACGPRIGFRCVVSSGGELNRDAADLLAFLAADEGTTAIGLFLETVRRPAAFAEALAAAAEAGKPVVCLKVGRSEAAARATLAHTGALVGSARAFSALLRRHGAIEVDDVHELLATLDVLGRRRRPAGRRIAAVSESGGECALLADQGERAGLPFEPLPEAVAATLRAEFANFVSPGNPLDAWAIAEAEVVYPRSFELLAHSGAYDVLLAQIDLSQFRGPDEQVWCELAVRALADAVEGTDVFPAVTTVHSSDPPLATAELARERDVPILRGTGDALRALAAAARWRPSPVAPVAPTGPAVELSDLLVPGALPEHESAECLERYGLAFAPRRRAAGPEEAAAAAADLGPPVVVKRDGPAHKRAEGGVVLGLETPAAAADAARRLGGRVLVARQVGGLAEAFCGMTRDPDYGPVLAVGLGGSAVEALSRVTACLAPVDEPLARRLIEQTPGLADAPEAARRDLAGVLVALGRLAAEHPEIEAVDVNPLFVREDGAVAVDALVVCAPHGGEE